MISVDFDCNDVNQSSLTPLIFAWIKGVKDEQETHFTGSIESDPIDSERGSASSSRTWESRACRCHLKC